MSAIYKLDERSFNRGVSKALTMKPLVQAIKGVTIKSKSYSEKSASSKNVTTVAKSWKR